jgi:hypothetical protein
MPMFYPSKKIYCVKIINSQTLKKIRYKSKYKNNEIYHHTKLYFDSDKHTYHVLTKLNKYSIGDTLTIVYYKYVNCDKRYIKSIRR